MVSASYTNDFCIANTITVQALMLAIHVANQSLDSTFPLNI